MKSDKNGSDGYCRLIHLIELESLLKADL
jgi:hypothetical protein